MKTNLSRSSILIMAHLTSFLLLALLFSFLSTLVDVSASQNFRSIHKLQASSVDESEEDMFDDSSFGEISNSEFRERLLLSGNSSDGNLIANGGFEFFTGRKDPINFNFSVNLINTSILEPHNDIQNWTVCGVVNYIYSDVLRPSGPRLVQLGYSGKDIYDCGGWISTISQTVKTVKGTQYNLTFDVGPFFDPSCQGSTTVFLKIEPSDYLPDNSLSFTLLRVNTTFETQSIIFTAKSNDTVISFKEPLGESPPCYFIYIDNVGLYPIVKAAGSVAFVHIFQTLIFITLISILLI